MMKKWFWLGLLLLILTASIRLLASYQQQSHLVGMKVAPAVLEHMDPGMAPEDQPRPADDWRGQTGLSAETETQLMVFLHLKLGESDDDPSALQPEDLTYLGAFEQDEGLVRYWLLPSGYGDLYGTVTMDGNDAPVFGVASTPPNDADAQNSPATDPGLPMEPDDSGEEQPDAPGLLP
jgi:hypothetical protein